MSTTFKFRDGDQIVIPPVIRSPVPDPSKPRPAAPKPASSAEQIWNYSVAVVNWKKSGSPLRSEEEVAAFTAVCEACPYFAPGRRPHCRLCGCYLKNAPLGLTNKIQMATEHCPNKKW